MLVHLWVWRWLRKIKMNWRFLVAATLLFAWGIDLPEARGGRKKGKAPKAGKFQRAVVAVSSGALKGWVQAAPRFLLLGWDLGT